MRCDPGRQILYILKLSSHNSSLFVKHKPRVFCITFIFHLLLYRLFTSRIHFAPFLFILVKNGSILRCPRASCRWRRAGLRCASCHACSSKLLFCDGQNHILTISDCCSRLGKTCNNMHFHQCCFCQQVKDQLCHHSSVWHHCSIWYNAGHDRTQCRNSCRLRGHYFFWL